MSGKKLIGMAVALAVLAGIAMLQQQGARKRGPEPGEARTLFQGLELNSVNGVQIFQGSEEVTLEKKEGKWTVESLYGYPADFSKLADALRAASEVETGRPVRSANIDAAEFGFDEPKTVVLKTGDKEAVRIEIGAQREASETAGWATQRFVRFAGEEAVYLVDYDFRPFATDPDRWIDTDLLNIASSDIVSVKTADGAELKEDAGTWTLVGLDEEAGEFQTSEANQLRSALQYLRCTSVAAPDTALIDPEVYTASTTNRTVTVTVGGEADGGRLVRFGGDVPEKLEGWTYVVSSYNADRFLITRDELVKPKEEEPPETEASQE